MEGRIVSVSEGTKEIGTEFQGKDIEEVRIPEGVTSIGEGAFKDCTELRSISFPSTLETISREAFSGCKQLKIQKLPASLRDIGENAFSGCISIESFDIEEGNDVFVAYKGAIYSKKWDLIAYPPGCKEKSYETPDDTGRIRDYAFNSNPYIKTIGLGKMVTDVTGKAFLGCKNLSEIWARSENEIFCNCAGILYKDLGSFLVFVPPKPRKLVQRLVGVHVLGTSCLAECDGLDLIELNDCIEEIAPDAFGEKCRPKKLYIDNDFDCELPFEIIESDEEPSRFYEVGGRDFIRRKDGKYHQCGFFAKPDDPFDRFSSPDCNTYGDDDGEPEGFHPVKVTDTKFSDIAGLEEAKDLMYKNLILPAKHPELFDRFDMEGNTGVLLYGPPGTGKTMLARAVASEMDAKFYSIKSTDIRNCYVGKSEENIKELFETARSDGKAVIFFDDFDSIGRARGNNSEPWQSDLIDEILVQMQGIEKHNGKLMVLAATNRPWEIDSALMRSGRFSTHIHVGLPNAEARETIIRNRLSKIPHTEDIDLKALAKRTDGYNAADVEEVCRTAKMRRISLIDSGEKITEVSMDDFDYALTKVHSSVSKKDLKDIEEYRRTGCTPDSEGYQMNDIPAGEVPPGYC